MSNDLKNNPFYFSIYDLLLSIREEPEYYKDESLVRLNFNKVKRPSFDIIFWGNQNRITCTLEGFEIFDEYLTNKNEVKSLVEFLKGLLSYDIILIEYFKGKKILLKRELIYKSFIEGEIKEYSDKQNLKISFPWDKVEKNETVFKPWI